MFDVFCLDPIVQDLNLRLNLLSVVSVISSCYLVYVSHLIHAILDPTSQAYAVSFLIRCLVSFVGCQRFPRPLSVTSKLWCHRFHQFAPFLGVGGKVRSTCKSRDTSVSCHVHSTVVFFFLWKSLRLTSVIVGTRRSVLELCQLHL